MQDNVDFKHIEGYEGYILQECMSGRLKVLVLNPDMTVMDIPPEMLEHIVSDSDVDMLQQFKENAKKYLKEAKNKKEGDPAFANIDNTNNFADVESFLLQSGVTEKELNLLYRSFIEHE